MMIKAQIRLETCDGTVLFIKKDDFLGNKDRIMQGIPFVFTSEAEFKGDLKERYLSRNRVVCNKVKNTNEGSWLYVSLHMSDLGNER